MMTIPKWQEKLGSLESSKWVVKWVRFYVTVFYYFVHINFTVFLFELMTTKFFNSCDSLIFEMDFDFAHCTIAAEMIELEFNIGIAISCNLIFAVYLCHRVCFRIIRRFQSLSIWTSNIDDSSSSSSDVDTLRKLLK